MFFKEIIGQRNIKKKLIENAGKGRLAHAQLFHGKAGFGGLPLAIAYAQYISCENKQESDSCGTCKSCVKYQKLIHPDLHFIFPVNTTGNVTKDPASDDFMNEWREFVLKNPYFTSDQWYEFIGIENKQGLINKTESQNLIQKLSYKSFEAEYKTVIIWLPEKMNDTASNKLLKLIEEPEGKTLFFLISENPDQIIPTILSRVQQVKIPEIEEKDLSEGLRKKFTLTDEELSGIARLAGGDYTYALEIIDTSEQTEYNLQKFIDWMRLCYKKSIPELVDWVDEIHTIGRERQKSFLSYSLKMLRENFILNNKLKNIVYMNKDENDFSKNFHPFINHSNVNEMYRELNKAYNDIEYNAYSKVVFLDTSLHLVKLIKN